MPSVAQAQNTEASKVIELEWISPDDCRLAASVQSAVTSMVKNVPALPQRVRVVITQIRDTWSATLDWRLGTRRLEGTSCEELAETMAVVIALAVGPSNTEAAQPHEQSSSQAAAPVAAATSSNQAVANEAPLPQVRKDVAANGQRTDHGNVVVTTPKTKFITLNQPFDSPAPKPARSWKRSALTLSGGVGVMGELGALPHAAAAGTVGLRIAGAVWAVRARGAAFFTQEAESANRSVGTVTLRLGAVEPCMAIRWLADRWEACASFEYGAMLGSGEGILHQGSSGSTAWYALGGNFGWWLELVNHLYLEPRLGAVFPLFHPAFRIDQVKPVHQVGIVSGRAELSLWLQY